MSITLEHGPVRQYVPENTVAGPLEMRTLAAIRLRRLYQADKISTHPKRKWLFNMYYSSLRRALTDKEAGVIVTLTEAASKELK